jgi:hypothetical protein
MPVVGVAAVTVVLLDSITGSAACGLLLAAARLPAGVILKAVSPAGEMKPGCMIPGGSTGVSTWAAAIWGLAHSG